MPKKFTVSLDTTKPAKVTAADVRAALTRHFPHPEFGIVFEVAQATGFDAHRHIDAVAMDTWPSRGLALHAIEIKVSSSDWKREKADPAKAEQLARFCDYFWVAAPRRLIPATDVPMSWGLLELDGKDIVRTKHATKTECEPVTRAFMAAIFRASGRAVDPRSIEPILNDRLNALEAEFGKRVAEEAVRRSDNNSEAAKFWAELMEALGEDDPQIKGSFHHWFQTDAAKVRAIFKAMKASGIMESWHGLAALHKTVSDMEERLRKAIVTLHVETSHIAAEK